MTASWLRSSVVLAAGVIIAFALGVGIGLFAVPVTATVTQTTTQTATQTVTVTRLSMGAVLVANNGTGKANSQPFTATTANVKISLNVTATASANYTLLYWAIYQVGGSVETCYGSVSQQQGSFYDYCYGLTVGANYYVQVDAAGFDWRVAVVEIR